MRARLDNYCEKGILLLALAILIFAPLATGAVRPLERLIVQGLVVGVLLLCIPRFWLRESYRMLFPPVCWVVLAFAGYAVYRYFTADIEYVARQELLKVVVYAALFFAVLDNLHRQESIQWIVMVLVFVAMAVSMYAVYQFLTNSPNVWHFIKPSQYMRRGSGTFVSPNHLAGFLEVILPLGLAATFLGRAGHAVKVFVGYASLVILAGIGVTISRGGWIATAISLFVFFLILVKNRWFRIPALIVLALLIGGGIFFAKRSYDSQKRFEEIFQEGKVQNVRFRLWKPAVEMWRDHFWLGVGPGHFDYRFREYRPFDIQMRPLYVHNDYLNTLTDWGVVGGVFVAAALVCVYQGIFRVRKFLQRSNDLTARTSNRSAFVLGGGVGLLAVLIHCVVDFNMQIHAIALLVVTLMALLTAHLRFGTDRYWVNPGVIGRAAVTLGCVLAAGFLAYYGVRGAREYRLLRRAAVLQKDPAKVQEWLDVLKRAHAVEPFNFETTQQIAEIYRALGFQGEQGYKELTQQALDWFSRSKQLNPFDSYNYVGSGRCLDWLGRHEEAETEFKRGLELDPQGYFTVASMGWHYFYVKRYEEAREWFEKGRYLSLYRLHTREPEPVTTKYLEILDKMGVKPRSSP